MQRNSSTPPAEILIRHRWLNLAVPGACVCDRRAVPIYSSPDPACPGCRLAIPYSEIGYPDRWRYDARTWRDRMPLALLEAIAVRLDLRAMERQIESREAVRRAS